MQVLINLIPFNFSFLLNLSGLGGQKLADSANPADPYAILIKGHIHLFFQITAIAETISFLHSGPNWPNI